MLKNYSLTLAVVCLGLISSCSTTPPNIMLCKEISMSKGWCTTVISGEEQFVDENNLLNGRSWWDQRQEMIQMPYKSWVDLKSYVIKSCKKYGHCDSSIAKYENTIQNIDKQIGE